MPENADVQQPDNLPEALESQRKGDDVHMASQAYMMDLGDRISKCHSSSELTTLIVSNPAVLLSKTSMGTIIQNLPKIISGESAFNPHLIHAIAETYVNWSNGRRNHSDNFDDYPSPNSLVSWTWIVDFLSAYARTLGRITDGRCFETLLGPYETPFHEKHPVIRSQEEFMGWLYLVYDYTLDHGFDRDMSVFLEHSDRLDSRLGFLMALNDIVYVADEDACRLLANVWTDSDIRSRSIMKFGILNNDCFIARCRDHDVSWLLQQYARIEPDKLGEATIEKATDLFMVVGNCFADITVARSFVFEYVFGTITDEIGARRVEVAENYEDYFRQDTIGYMADLTSEIYTAFSNVNADDLMATKAAQRIVDKKIEGIVEIIHAMHPDVDAKVVFDFLVKTADCIGFEVAMKANLSWASIRAIVQEVYRRGDIDFDPKADEPASESIDIWSILAAMEGSYGSDDATSTQKPQTAPKKTNSAGTQIVEPKKAGPTLQNGSVHRTAGTQQKAKTAEAVNTAERRLYSSYRKYKDNEDKVDATFNKAIGAIKRAIVGDQQAILIEGKTFSVTGFLKKLFATVAIFNYSKIALVLSIVVTNVLKRKTRTAERRQLIMELEGESKMLEEKIEDAKRSNNNQAKYDLMRSKIAVDNALKRLKYGMGAEMKPGTAMNRDLKSSRNYDIKKYRG